MTVLQLSYKASKDINARTMPTKPRHALIADSLAILQLVVHNDLVREDPIRASLPVKAQTLSAAHSHFV
jgi:hypothetical protein